MLKHFKKHSPLSCRVSQVRVTLKSSKESVSERDEEPHGGQGRSSTFYVYNMEEKIKTGRRLYPRKSGTFALGTRESNACHIFPWIYFIDPPFRRMGVGQALIRRCLSPKLADFTVDKRWTVEKRNRERGLAVSGGISARRNARVRAEVG